MRVCVRIRPGNERPGFVILIRVTIRRPFFIIPTRGWGGGLGGCQGWFSEGEVVKDDGGAELARSV